VLFFLKTRRTAYASSRQTGLDGISQGDMRGGKREMRRTLTWGGHHGDGRPNMQDPEEDPPFGDELFERPLERVPAAPAPAHRHRHRAADGSIHHLRPLSDGFLDPLHLSHLFCPNNDWYRGAEEENNNQVLVSSRAVPNPGSLFRTRCVNSSEKNSEFDGGEEHGDIREA
jgi:hypothetical protein